MPKSGNSISVLSVDVNRINTNNKVDQTPKIRFGSDVRSS